MPPTQIIGYRAKKSTKIRFFHRRVKLNKKLRNGVYFLFNIYVTREKSTAYAKFERYPKNHLKFLKRRRVK